MRFAHKLLSSFATLILFAGPAAALPNPTGVSGTPGNGNTITVTGSGFGLKQSPVNAASSLPWLFFDFEAGSFNNTASLSAGPTTTMGTQNMSVTTEARGSSTKDLRSDNVNWAQFSLYGGIVAVDVLMPSVGRGGLVYKYQKRKSAISAYTHNNGGTTQYENWKFDRFWNGTNGSGYPNAYNAQNADSSSSCTGGGQRPSPSVEAGSGSNYVRTSSAYRLPGSTWMAEERLLKMNSANTVGDGLYKIRQDGQLNIDRADWATDPSASFPSTGLRRWYTQDDPSNLGDCGGTTIQHDVFYDDLIYDYGTYAWARVMLGNASTLAACTIMEYQPETSLRSDGTAIFKERDGELTSNTTKYIYVFDKDDAVNSSGRLLQAGVGNPPPVLSAVTPSTGTYPGGTVLSLSGASFVSGATVQVGTMTAVASTFVSATSLFATVPGGAPGSTVDVKVINPDAQFSIVSSTFTFSQIPGQPIQRDPDPIRDDGKVFNIFIVIP